MAPGRQRLREWITRSKLSQNEASELLDMHFTFLSQILNGFRSPALATAVRIERVTGIPVEAWLPTDVAYEREAVGAGAGKRTRGKA